MVNSDRKPGWNPFIEGLEMEVPHPADGKSRASLLAVPRLHNPFEMVHGAALFAMADCTMGEALATLLDEDEFSTTIENKINYLRPVLNGVVTCESTVIHKGRSTAVLESFITNDGKLVAKAQGTYAIQKRTAR